jgi:hypothetical protein
MPTPSSALTRPDLEASFQEFNLEARAKGFIADQVLPAIDVNLRSATFKVIPVEALLAERDTARASSGTYSRQDYKFEEGNFQTSEHGAEEPVDDRDVAIYGSYFNAEQLAAARAVNAVLTNREKRAAAAIFNATTFTSYTGAVSNEWDDLVNATPISDIQTAAEAVFTQSGLIANALIVNAKVLRNIKNCDDVVERLKYSGFSDPKNVSNMDLAALLFPDVPNAKIVVAGAPRNSKNAGQASVTIARIWSDEYAMIARVPETNDLREPCMARTFHYTGDGSSLYCTMESYRDEKVRGDIVRARHEVQEKVMLAAAGYLLSNVTT